jgi:hypothetical protein
MRTRSGSRRGWVGGVRPCQRGYNIPSVYLVGDTNHLILLSMLITKGLLIFNILH